MSPSDPAIFTAEYRAAERAWVDQLLADGVDQVAVVGQAMAKRRADGVYTQVALVPRVVRRRRPTMKRRGLRR